MSETKEKRYDKEKRAVDNLARDIEKHGNGKVSEQKAHEMARDIAKKRQDQERRGG